MPPTSRPVNLVNLERVSKSYGVDPVLSGVSLGIAAGERIGVVGRNGGGKTTLLRILGGQEEPDSGRVTHTGGLRVAFLSQGDALDPDASVAQQVLGDAAEHELYSHRRVRDVLQGLLAGIETDRTVGELSGGERRRVALATLLVGEHDLLLLDEPTNHLDIEVTDWLARHLNGRPEALAVVTHDRWFLDAVCTRTWEVVDAGVASYDGGYSAFVLARAERERVAEVAENRRQNLLRKELAWLHRGAKARTSKPKFRLDAAANLIADEPPPRDSLELAKFATARLGKTVVDLEHATVEVGERQLLSDVDWQFGPGDRIGVVGVNGAGKTTLLRLVAGELEPSAGRVRHGQTVELAHLVQDVTEIDPQTRVLAAVEEIRSTIRLAPNVRPGAVGRRPVPSSGAEVSASQLLERFGFSRKRLQTRVGDLSGGERRRLQLLRLLIGEPNVLLLDEPTNDLDIDVLTVIEDFLDSWPGSLMVVSHDRYFLERVCDSIWALMGDGSFKLLPGGVEEYLERRRAGDARTGGGDAAAPTAGPATADASAGRNPPKARATPGTRDTPSTPHSSATMANSQSHQAGSASSSPPAASVTAAEERAAKKELSRLERSMSKLSHREEKLLADIAEHASDYEQVMPLDEELRGVREEKQRLEERWLEVAEALE